MFNDSWQVHYQHAKAVVNTDNNGNNKKNTLSLSDLKLVPEYNGCYYAMDKTLGDRA